MLKGEHIRITPMTEQDEAAYSQLLLGELHDRFEKTLGLKPPARLTSTLNHTSGDETHAIRLLDDEHFIGWITLQKNEENKPDIGISLIVEQQNKGFGPEAVMLFANRLHDVYGLKEVFVRISDKNVQSQRAFAKVGAVFDRALPDGRFTALTKVYEDTSDSFQLPEGVALPMLYHYHIPLPIEGYYKIPDSAEVSSTNRSKWTQRDEMAMIMGSAALDELLKLEKEIEQIGSSDIEKLKEHLHSRMNELKKE